MFVSSNPVRTNSRTARMPRSTTGATDPRLLRRMTLRCCGRFVNEFRPPDITMQGHRMFRREDAEAVNATRARLPWQDDS